MRGIGAAIAILCASGLSGLGFGQQGGDQGPVGREAAMQRIDAAIGGYLNRDENKSILTPGETVDYPLDLKAGQVVVGEARSEAFDPALEILDPSKKAQASNDDRYPGDQRPLILWRCPADGTYTLRVRCFHDRSGGQVFVRFQTYDSVDVPSEKEIPGGRPFLLRVPMKAGQIKTVYAETNGGGRGTADVQGGQVIAPNGLPDINLSQRIGGAVRAFMAPVAGDYYILANAGRNENERVRIVASAREILPAKLVPEGGGFSTTAATDTPVLAELTVRAGEFLQVATPELDLNSRLIVAEQPDVSKYDTAKPETNPFFPQPYDPSKDLGRAFDLLPARARDGRVMNFQARRDAKLWVATNGAGPDGKTFTLRIRPAAAEFKEGAPNIGRLQIAYADHWAFEAKAGDVMTLNFAATGFNAVVVVRDPGLGEIRHEVMGLDQTADAWRMVVQRPGRYLVQISALGDGGSGDYTLARKSFPPKEFTAASPAMGEISAGEIQVWRFTVRPNDPLLVRWSLSPNAAFDVAVYDENGGPTDFQRQAIDAQTVLGIIAVGEPRTYIIVLTGTGAKTSYKIGLSAIPK